MSTFKVDNIQSSNTSPSVFKNVNGTEIGQLVKCWINYAGAAGSVNRSFNISSTTKNGTSDYSFTYSIAFPDATYCAVYGRTLDASGYPGWGFVVASYVSSSLRIYSQRDTAGNMYDSSVCNVLITR